MVSCLNKIAWSVILTAQDPQTSNKSQHCFLLIENPWKILFDTYDAPSSRIIFKVETDNVDDCNLYDEEYLYTENLWPGGPRQLFNPVFWIEVRRFDYLRTKPPRGLSINIGAKIKAFNSVYLFSFIFLY